MSARLFPHFPAQEAGIFDLMPFPSMTLRKRVKDVLPIQSGPMT